MQPIIDNHRKVIDNIENTLLQSVVNVVLGRPSADCRHFGICRIEAVDSPQKFGILLNQSRMGNYRRSAAGILSWQTGIQLELSLWRSTIPPAMFRRHFGKGHFLIEEDYFLPKSIFGKEICCRQGEYNIEVTETLIKVEFLFNH